MEIKEGVLSCDDLAVKTPDEKTLIIELENSIPCFFELITTPIFFPIKGMLHWIGSPLSIIHIDRINETSDTKVAPFSGTSFLRINTKRFGKDCNYFNKYIRKALALAINR